MLVIGAIVLGIYLANTIIRPLGQLTFAVDQLREGNRDIQMTIESQDEIGILARSFNQMSNELFQTTVSRDYVENILQAMGSVLIVADEQGQIETSNAFSQQLLGYSEADLQGRNVQTLFDNLQALKLDAATSRSSIITKSGEYIPVTLSRRKVGDSHLVVYNAQDLTQIERMQQQLIEAQSQVEAQFKRGNRIYTMMDLMRRQLNNVFEHGASREELREYMDMLNTEFEKLSVVIKDSNN
jgi:PAS domain S-box-containing protein